MAFLEASLKLITFWLAVDTVIIVTGWYLFTAIKPRCPDWWRRYIADDLSGQRPRENRVCPRF